MDPYTQGFMDKLAGLDQGSIDLIMRMAAKAPRAAPIVKKTTSTLSPRLRAVAQNMLRRWRGMTPAERRISLMQE